MIGETKAYASHARLMKKAINFNHLREKTGATSINWLDADNHIQDIDRVTASLDLSGRQVLAAGVMAAARSIVQLFGDGEPHQRSLEGTHLTLHFQCILPKSPLLVACPSTVPLGLKRLHARRAAQSLSCPAMTDTPSFLPAEFSCRASAQRNFFLSL